MPDSEEYNLALEAGKAEYKCMYEYLEGRILKI